MTTPLRRNTPLRGKCLKPLAAGTNRRRVGVTPRVRAASPKLGRVSFPDVHQWGRFSLDPRQPSSAPMRASDDDRQIALQLLAAAYADGRITRDEYDERADAAAAVTTLGDLPPLLTDLVPAERPSAPRDLTSMGPDELRARARQAYEARLRHALLGMLIPSLICILIWVVGGFGPDGWEMEYPWPLFVVIGTGIHPLRVRRAKQDIVDREHARLEKKQRKALEAPRREQA
jgi:hypothetical protein